MAAFSGADSWLRFLACMRLVRDVELAAVRKLIQAAKLCLCSPQAPRAKQKAFTQRHNWGAVCCYAGPKKKA